MSIFLQDTFTDTPGTLLQNHTADVGGKWTRNANSVVRDAVISPSGELMTSNGGADVRYLAGTTPGSADYTITWTIKQYTGTGGRPRIFARAGTDLYANGYCVFFDGTWLELHKIVGGVDTQLVYYFPNLADNTSMNVKWVIRNSGVIHEVYVNNVSVMTSNDTTFTAAGNVGLGWLGDGGNVGVGDRILNLTATDSTTSNGIATKLALTQQPGGAQSTLPLAPQPVVEIRDSGNTLVPGSTVAVTASIASGTGTLTGTTTVNAVNGVATFTNLAINGVGAYTLTFTSGALTAVTSGSVTTTAAVIADAVSNTFTVVSSLSSTGTVTATPKNAAGTALTGKTITFSSSNTSIATVNSSGLVTGVGAGTCTVKATVDGVDSNLCTVTVS